MVRNVLFLTEAPSNKAMFLNTLPPLGTLSIAAYIRSKGINVSVIDGNIDEVNEELLYKQDAVAMSINISNVVNSKQRAKNIKEHNPNAKIIAGGVYPREHADDFLSDNFDVVVSGEGEITLHEYLTTNDPLTVLGLYILKDGKTHFTGVRPKIKDLDSLPFPALDLVDIKKYHYPLKKKTPFSTIITSRDCPHECIFCYHERGWRARSEKNVVDEIEWQVNTLGVKEIAIIDDFFNLNMERVEKICDLIIERKIKVALQCWGGLRVDRVSKQMLEKLKKAGTWLIGMAPESGNPETLVKVKKRFTKEQVINVRRWCKELGLVSYAFFMVGFPWEDKKQIENTLDFARELDAEITQFSRVYPIQGTELYDMVNKEQGYTESKEDVGFFYGGARVQVEGLTGEEVEKLIQKGYRKIYLRPKKMFDLLRALTIPDIYTLTKYAFTTNSI